MATKTRGRQVSTGNLFPVGIPDFASGDEPDAGPHPNRYISIDGALVRSNGTSWNAVGVGGAGTEPTLALDFSTGNVILTADEFADNFRFTSDADLTTARSMIVGTPSPQYFAVANPAGSSDDLTVVIGSSTEPVAPGIQSVFYADGTANGLVLLSSTSFSFDDGTDTPASKTGAGGKRVAVDDAEAALIYVDDATLALNVTAGNASVTAAQFIANYRYVPTAVLTTARTFTFPSGRPKAFQVQNPTGSGANNLSVVVGATTIVVASGKERVFYTDGTANGLVQVTDDDTLPTVGGNAALAGIRGMIERVAPTNNWAPTAWSATNNLYAALAQSGTGDRAQTSKNGLDWVSRTSSADKTWAGLAWDETLGVFVGVAVDADNVATSSTDGITWTGRTHAGTPSMAGIASDGLLFAAVGATGACETTPDGITWTARTTPNASNYAAIAHSPSLGLFCAVASTGTINAQIMTSPDGVTWTARNGVEANQWATICWSEDLSLFVAGAKSGTNRVMTSPDGVNWTARTAAFQGFFGACVWSPAHEYFLMWSTAAIDAQIVMYSTDGITWEVGNADVTASWNTAVYSAEREQVCVVSPTFTSVTP